MIAAGMAAKSWWPQRATTRVQARKGQIQYGGGANLVVALATWPFVARPKLVRNVEWQWRSSATCAVALDMRRRIIRFRRPRWRRRLGSLTLSRAVARARARNSARTNANEAFVSLGGTRVRAIVARIVLSPTRQQVRQRVHLGLHWLLGSLLARAARQHSRRRRLS